MYGLLAVQHPFLFMYIMIVMVAILNSNIVNIQVVQRSDKHESPSKGVSQGYEFWKVAFVFYEDW